MTATVMDRAVSLLVHRACHDRVASELDRFCLESQGAHVHWYTTNTKTTSAFDITMPRRCIQGTLLGAELHLVDTLAPHVTSQHLGVNELGAYLRVER